MSHNDDHVSPSFNNREDFESVFRGFIDSLNPCIIRASDGRIVWNNDQYSFVEADCPQTVNQSLWRQAQLCYKQGLFKVTEGIYQVRGLDISNMTIVEGSLGIVIIDPLISAKCAAAALALYRRHRGESSSHRTHLLSFTCGSFRGCSRCVSARRS